MFGLENGRRPAAGLCARRSHMCRRLGLSIGCWLHGNSAGYAGLAASRGARGDRRCAAAGNTARHRHGESGCHLGGALRRRGALPRLCGRAHSAHAQCRQQLHPQHEPYGQQSAASGHQWHFGWSSDKTEITLDEKGERRRYAVSWSELRMLQHDGSPMLGVLGEQLTLKKRSQ